MSKVSVIKRIQLKRINNQNLQNRQKILTIILQKFLTKLDTQFLLKKKQKLEQKSSKVRLIKYCWHTGRTSGFSRTFGLSRLSIRLLGHNSLLPGLKKDSW